MLDEHQRLFPIPRMIAQRHCISTGGKNTAIDILSDAETTAGRVLAVDDSKVYFSL
jgi:hypothetical protein